MLSTKIFYVFVIYSCLSCKCPLAPQHWWATLFLFLLMKNCKKDGEEDCTEQGTTVWSLDPSNIVSSWIFFFLSARKNPHLPHLTLPQSCRFQSSLLWILPSICYSQRKKLITALTLPNLQILLLLCSHPRLWESNSDL